MSDWNTAVIERFRAGAPRVADRFDRDSLVLLHTTGARSGEARVSPVVFFRFDDRAVVVASAAGADRHPAWFHNLKAQPRLTAEWYVDGARTEQEVVATEADPTERERLWPELTASAPGFAEYQEKTDRIIPLVFLDPA